MIRMVQLFVVDREEEVNIMLVRPDDGWHLQVNLYRYPTGNDTLTLRDRDDIPFALVTIDD